MTGEYKHAGASGGPAEVTVPANRTLNQARLYVDRRVFGPAVTALCADLTPIAINNPGIELNVPEEIQAQTAKRSFKDLAINIVESKEVRRNRTLIGHLEKFKVIGQLAHDPTLTRRMSDIVEESPVRLDDLRIGRDSSGATYFSWLPDQETQQIIHAEYVRSWVTIANLAHVALTKLGVAKPRLDCRFAYVKDGVSPKVIRRMSDIFAEHAEHGKLEVDMLPGIKLNHQLFQP